jgi:hypothetical protein
LSGDDGDDDADRQSRGCEERAWSLVDFKIVVAA